MVDVHQWGIGDGLVVGPGGEWTVEGFKESRGRRRHLSALPYDDGAVGAGDALLGTYQLELRLGTSGTAEVVQGRIRALEQACAPGVVRVRQHQAGEGVRFADCESDDPQVVRITEAAARAVVSFEAADPLLYDDVEQAVVLQPYVGTVFADYPESEEYPKLYASGGEGGASSAVNDGTYPVWPRFEISGPSSGLVSPLALENVTTGQAIRFDGLTVGTGQTLIVDTHPARRIVAFESGASRLSTVVNLDAWWRLVPGVNEMRFRAGGTTDGASCLVAWHNGNL